MMKNKEITVEKPETGASALNPTPEQVQAEVDDLYEELERRFGAGFADQIIRRYTDLRPTRREGRS